MKGDTLEVLNKAFEIAPQDARRACTALFRAVPRARRIHLEVMFPPAELRLPLRTRYVTDHMMIDLPDTVDAYYASLGRSMRRNLRSARNHLRRDHPDAATAIVVAGDDGSALLEDFLTWKRARFGEKGSTTYWDDKPDLVGRFVELLRQRGEARGERHTKDGKHEFWLWQYRYYEAEGKALLFIDVHVRVQRLAGEAMDARLVTIYK